MAGMHIEYRPAWAIWGAGCLTYLFLLAALPSCWGKCNAKLRKGQSKTLVAGFLLTLIGSTCSKCWVFFLMLVLKYWTLSCRREIDLKAKATWDHRSTLRIVKPIFLYGSDPRAAKSWFCTAIHLYIWLNMGMKLEAFQSTLISIWKQFSNIDVTISLCSLSVYYCVVLALLTNIYLLFHSHF